MPRVRPNPTSSPAATQRSERRSQLRGLLMLAAITLMLILFRANRHAIFHPGWWRF